MREKSIMRLKRCAAVFCCAAAIAGSVSAADPAKPAAQTPQESVLIIGNSLSYYNCGLNAYLEGMMREGYQPRARVRLAAMSGAGLAHLPAEEMADSGATNARAALPDAPGAKLPLPKTVILQAGNRPAAAESDAAFLPEHVKAVKKIGAVPVLFLPWSPKDLTAKEVRQVRASAVKAAAASKLQIIPAGPAFDEAERLYPDLKLRVSDGRHPTAAGSYLAAAVIYASLFRRNPKEAAGFPGACEKPLDRDLRENLMKVAYSTVKAWNEERKAAKK